MAEVDGIVYKELTGEHGKAVFRCDLSGATSTISAVTHKLSQVDSFQVQPRGTNTATSTISGTTVTVTGTNNDTVDCVFYGKK